MEGSMAEDRWYCSGCDWTVGQPFIPLVGVHEEAKFVCGALEFRADRE